MRATHAPLHAHVCRRSRRLAAARAVAESARIYTPRRVHARRCDRRCCVAGRAGLGHGWPAGVGCMRGFRGPCLGGRGALLRCTGQQRRSLPRRALLRRPGRCSISLAVSCLLLYFKSAFELCRASASPDGTAQEDSDLAYHPTCVHIYRVPMAAVARRCLPRRMLTIQHTTSPQPQSWASTPASNTLESETLGTTHTWDPPRPMHCRAPAG